MIELSEAYRKIKEQMDEPIIYLAESDNYFIGSNSFYVLVNKDTGEVTKLYDAVSFLIETDFGSVESVYYQVVFDDFINYYRMNPDEKHLASLYVSVWFQVYYDSPKYNKFKKSFCGEELAILEKWSEIEQILYDRILSIINGEKYYYPPCVLKNFDDHFFRIKPFMLRYGYTDNGDWLWVKAARLTPIEAYNKFKKKFPEKRDVSAISDFGDFYFCSNGQGDMVDDDWKINPYSGEINPMDFAELAEELRNHPDGEGIIQYEVDELLCV